MNWSVAAIALVGVAISNSAQSADLYVKSASPVFLPAPVANWTGAYAGIHGGYGSGSDLISVEGFTPYSFNHSGAIAGLQAGYNLQQGSVVYGVEADISYKGLRGNDGGFAGFTDTIDANWGGTLRARVGYLAGPLLLYATGGLAWLNYNYTSVQPGPNDVNATPTDLGFVAGVGGEFKFDSRWSAKLEYRHTWFQSQTWTTNQTWTTRLNLNEFLVGLNMKLN